MDYDKSSRQSGYCLWRRRIVWKIFGQWSHALDYTRQATNLGVKTLCGWLRQRSNPSSNQFSFCTVSTMASSVTSGDVLTRSYSSRLSQSQKPLRSQYNTLTRLRWRFRKTKSTGSNTATLNPARPVPPDRRWIFENLLALGRGTFFQRWRWDASW